MVINPYLKNLKCLYVEDDEFIKESFSFMLKRYFKDVIVAKDGEEGLDKFRKEKVDIVISDIRMPKMDGIKMAKEIKNINPNIYIIFVTAFNDIEYLKSAIELNIEGYLTKPIKKEILIKKLNFLADVIKNEKETKELLQLLKIIFEKQNEGIVLYYGKEPKLYNKKFADMFFDSISIDELIKKYNIDISKSSQTIDIKRDGHTKTYSINITKISQNYMLLSFIDITEYKMEAFIDDLTKLYNRKYLDLLLKELCNKRVCLIELDIDYFKKINDTFGHQFGDEVLQQIAKILKNNLRDEDIIIRMGGEEFLIVPNIENIDTASKIAQKLRKAIEKYDFKKVKITSSFGVCCGQIGSFEEFKRLYSLADKALYKAKKNGRNRVQVCKK